MTTRPRRYGPFDPHAPNNEDLTHPITFTMVVFTLKRSATTPNNPPRRSGLSEGFPRTYSGPREATTSPNLGVMHIYFHGAIGRGEAEEAGRRVRVGELATPPGIGMLW